MVSPDDDVTRELLKRVTSGDRTAEEELFEVYRPLVRNFVRARFPHVIQKRLDISDVVQDTLLIASKRLHDFLSRKPMPFWIWLLKTANEQLIEVKRRHIGAQRRSIRQEADLPDDTSAMIAGLLLSPDPSPSSQFQRKERAEALLTAVRAMPPLDQQILLMRHVESRAHSEIALILDLEPATVRQRYGRALKRLVSALSVGGTAENSQ